LREPDLAGFPVDEVYPNVDHVSDPRIVIGELSGPRDALDVHDQEETFDLVGELAKRTEGTNVCYAAAQFGPDWMTVRKSVKYVVLPVLHNYD
jgi:hypothetical protein